MSANTLFKESLTVVNVGLTGFADAVVAAGGQCVALGVAAARTRRSRWRMGAGRGAESPGDRGRQRRRVRAVPRCPAGADRCRRRARRAAGHGRRTSADRARGAADRLVGDVRADAWRGAGRGGARRMGRFGGRRRAPGRGGRTRSRTLPSPGRRRTDVRDHQPVDAGLRRREQGRGQSRVLQLQRRARQGAALRRQRPGGDRPFAHDRRRRRARRCAPCWRAPAPSSSNP